MKIDKYKKVAKEVIDIEILALKKLKKSINKSFGQAVNAIAKCQSKIILCGVGKSGHVASRISATLSSVGSPSFALSASDCSHGDLGSISKKDILILIYLTQLPQLRQLKKLLGLFSLKPITRRIGIMAA